MFFGAVVALLLCNAKDVVRRDGSKVVLMKHPTFITEFVGLWETLTYEPMVVLLFPMFWSSNWFITYQANGVNTYQGPQQPPLLPRTNHRCIRLRIRHGYSIIPSYHSCQSIPRLHLRPHNGNLGWRIRICQEIQSCGR
jgi:hypothetical protein